MPLPKTINIGPFKARYHGELVDGVFCDDADRFIRFELASQVDHPIEGTFGSVAACFDEDRYCGPKSVVRNLFRFSLTFRGSGDESTIRTDVYYDPQTGKFAPRRGSSLYVWTPERRQLRQRHENDIQAIVNAVLDGNESTQLCPICGAELFVMDCAGAFDLFCPARCFKYNFHKDADGNPSHGHFIMSDPKD